MIEITIDISSITSREIAFIIVFSIGGTSIALWLLRMLGGIVFKVSDVLVFVSLGVFLSISARIVSIFQPFFVGFATPIILLEKPYERLRLGNYYERLRRVINKFRAKEEINDHK